MRTARFLAGAILGTLGLLSIFSAASAQDSPLPPATSAPALVLDPGAPAAPVTALAFSPDSSTLYVAGLDKVVRKYTLQKGRFAPAKPSNPIHVPLGPGNAGAINALAVSPDGKWLAVGGRAPFREEAWFGDKGGVIGSSLLTADQKKDVGVVYLVDPANPAGGKVIRGAAGEVRGLAFATPNPAGGPALVVASLEWVKAGKQVGAVRVFDGNSGKELASRTDLPDTASAPGLAAWPSGDARKGLQVAINWRRGDGREGDLLVWDTAADETGEFKVGKFNQALALRLAPDGKPRDLWSGGYQETGQIDVRPINNLKSSTAVAFPPDPSPNLPRSVALGGETVAVAVQHPPEKDDTTVRAELRLLDLQGKKRFSKPLEGLAFVPAVSASPDGRWVAVRGFADHHVEIYDTATVAKPQIIAGAVSGPSGVAFLEGGRLWIGGTNDTPARGGVVFNFKTRDVKPNSGKDAVDAPAGSQPKWEFDAGKGQVVIDGLKTTFRLRGGERPDAVAFLLAGPAWARDAGLVIVAHTDRENAVSVVSIFDANSGVRLRQLVGPTQPVRALAVSGSRPLVAAVSADQAIFVWSLVDLAKAESAIEGLHVATRGKTVVVETIDAKNPALAKLKVGDVIEAVGGADGKLRPVTQSDKFRDEVGALPVGSEVRIQVKGKGVVAVRTSRGLGQRGPLFSLWIDPAGNGGVRDWIGWSPSGPYDASTPAAEARIGWLESTGDPARPTAFAGVGQYRKRYYKRGILEQLVEKGELVSALAALPPPQAPILDLSLTPLTEAADGSKLVRDPAARLEIALLDPDDAVVLGGAALQWRVTGPDGKPGPWQVVPIRDRAAIADLGNHAWARGEHTFEATISDVFDPKSGPAVRGSAKVQFVPPAAQITAIRVGGKAVKPGEELIVEDASIEVTADARSGDGGAVAVTLTTSATGGEKPRALKSADGKTFGPITAALNKESLTIVRLTAVNVKAADFAKEETAHVEFRVRHVPRPPPVPPPGLKAILESPHKEPDAVGGPRIVQTPSAVVSAAVTADKPVETFEWDLGDGKGWVKGEIDPKTKLATITVAGLEPGKSRKLRVRAKMKDGPFATDAVEIVFHPLPPVMAFGDLPASVLGPELVVGGTYSDATAGVAVVAHVVVVSPGLNQRQSFGAELKPGPDPAKGTWQARIRLFTGANKLGIAIDNTFAKRTTLDLAEVIYQQPPLLIQARDMRVSEGGIGDLVMRTLTAPELSPTAVIVNGSPRPILPPRRLATIFGAALWEVTAPNVSVKEGDKILDAVVRVVNADGKSGPAKVTILVPPPPPVPVPSPVIVLPEKEEGIGAGKTISVTEPVFTFGFRVNSAKRLIRAEVRYGLPNALVQLPLDLESQKEGDGSFNLVARPNLRLREGLNTIRIVVASNAGEVSTEFLVNFRPPPLYVEIVGIDVIDPASMMRSRPIILTPGEVPEADRWLVEVRGRVVWSRDNDPIANDPAVDVVVYANQVMHLPVALEKREGSAKERTFKAMVFLNAAETAIRVELRSRTQSAALAQVGIEPLEQMIRCRDPLTMQRLHVLVIGVGIPASEGPTLARNVVEAIGGKFPPNSPHFGVFHHPAFERAVLYVPELGQVDRPSVFKLVRHVQDEVIRTTAKSGSRWINDVILVYFHGQDLIGKDNIRRLHTSRSLPYEAGAADRYAIRLDELPETAGVRLVVLNVFGPPQSPGPAPPLASLPLLRFDWRDAALRSKLLELLHTAVTRNVKLGDIVQSVVKGVEAMNAATPFVNVPPPVRERRIGTAP
jgi:WD40 repeat protein